MPAKSKAQQRFMGMIHAIHKGEIRPPNKQMAELAKKIPERVARDYARKSAQDNLLSEEVSNKLKKHRARLFFRGALEGLKDPMVHTVAGLGGLGSGLLSPQPGFLDKTLKTYISLALLQALARGIFNDKVV